MKERNDWTTSWLLHVPEHAFDRVFNGFSRNLVYSLSSAFIAAVFLTTLQVSMSFLITYELHVTFIFASVVFIFFAALLKSVVDDYVNKQLRGANRSKLVIALVGNSYRVVWVLGFLVIVNVFYDNDIDPNGYAKNFHSCNAERCGSAINTSDVVYEWSSKNS